MKRRIISMFLAMLMVFMSVDLQVFAQSVTGCNQVGIQMIPETEKENEKETPTPFEGEEMESPMVEETEVPTKAPSEIPTEIPIEEPTQEPTEVPVEPTEIPVVNPTAYPTEVPSEIPTVTPKDEEKPNIMQTAEPSKVPEESMSPEPTETAVSLEARESVSPTTLVDEVEKATMSPTLHPMVVEIEPDKIIGSFTYATNSNGEITITKYSGSDSLVEIPNEIDGVPVVYLGTEAFKDCTMLEEVTIPENVKYVRDRVFYNCSQLKKVNWNCVEGSDYGDNVFGECPLLTTVCFGASTNVAWRNSKGNIFGSYLEEYVVDVNNPYFIAIDGVLYKKATDASGELTLMSYPIAKEGTSFSVDTRTVKIAKYAFAGVIEIVELNMTKNTENISDYAIMYCPSLMKIRFGGIDFLPYYAIYECAALDEVAFETNIDCLYAGSFWNCSSISKVIIGKDVTDVPYLYRLYDNENIEEYIVEEGNPALYTKEGVLYKKDAQEVILVQYPVSKEGATYEVADDTTQIAEYAFYKNNYLEKVTFGEGITSIGEYSFSNMEYLKEVDFSQIKNYCIGENAFCDCLQLKTIWFGYGLNELGYAAFDGCVELEEVLLSGDGSCYVDDQVFRDCCKLSKLTLDGVSYCGYSYGTGIEEVDIGNDLAELSEDFIPECEDLRYIKCGEENQFFSAEDGVLYNKEKKHLIGVPCKWEGKEFGFKETIETMAEEAFFGNSTIEMVVLNDKIMEIPYAGFRNCTALKEVVWGVGVETIGEYAFANCTSLEYVTIPDTIKTIGGYAYNESGLLVITIPSTVETIDYNAIPSCTIKGEIGTEAERYALEKGCIFVDLNAEPEDDLYFENEDILSEWDGTSTEEILPIENTYVISNAEQLAWVAQQVNDGITTFEGKKIVLTCDIDMQGNTWTPIGKGNTFRGSFDGQDNTISNITFVGSTGASGLFGEVYNRNTEHPLVIQNINLENVYYYYTSGYMGAVAGELYTGKSAKIIVENCSVSGTIIGKLAGSIVGIVYGGNNNSDIVIRNCTSTCLMNARGRSTLDTDPRTGGIVGDVRFQGNGCVQIEECRYEGKAYGVGYYGKPTGIVGGLSMGSVGTLIVKRCVVDGIISPGKYVSSAAILQEIPSGVQSEEQVHIYQCVNYADVSGYYAGGIVGNVAGGALIEQCVNIGTISGMNSGPEYGGIVGHLGVRGHIKDCNNLGTISNNSFAYNGGLVGLNDGTVECSYNLGTLPGSSLSSTSVSLPGSVTSINSGTIKYCYFDKDQSREVLVGTDAAPDYIQGETINGEDKRYTSGGLTTAEMKSEAGLIGWDFNEVWTFDPMYNWGYPVLSEVKDLLPKKAADSEKIVTSDSEFVVEIVDELNNPVSGASFTIEGEEAVLSNDVGKIVLNHRSGVIKGTVAKEGYGTYTFSFKMGSSGYYKIRIPNLIRTSKCDLLSVLLEYNGNEYELLTETKKINLNYKDTPFTIKCTLLHEDTEVGSYSVIQAGEIIAESKDGVFNVKIGDFKSQDPVYVKVSAVDGESLETLINLDVTEIKEIEGGTFEFGEDISFTVASNVPGLGGKKMTFEGIEVPFAIALEDDKYKVSINVAKGSVGEDFNEEGYEKVKKKFTSAGKGEDFFKDLDDQLDSGLLEFAKNPKVSMKLVGYAEGPVDLATIKGALAVEMSVSGNWEGQAAVAPIPVVFQIGLKGKIGLDGGIEWELDGDGIIGYLDMKGQVGVNVSAGVGVAYAASVYIFGELDWNITYALLPRKVSGLSEMYMEGRVGVGGRVLGQEICRLQIWPAKGDESSKIWIYRRDTDVLKDQQCGEMSEAQNADLSVDTVSSCDTYTDITQVLMTPENYSVIERNTYGTIWLGTESGNALINDAYGDAQIQVMRCGSDVILLFLNDGGDTRNEADKSTLMYSVFDATAQTWSEPKAVWDNGTADFNQYAYSDGNNGYVVWNDAKESLSIDDDVDAVALKTELSIAKYNEETKTFTDAEMITANSTYEMQPLVYVKNGTARISWIDNSNSDIFGYTGSNQLYMAVKNVDETWNQTKVIELESPLIGGSLGELDGKLCYTYIWDQDGEVISASDQIPYIVSMDEGVKVQLSGSNSYSVHMTKVNGQPAVLWNDEQNIYYKTSMEGNVHTVYTEGKDIGAISEVFTDGNKTAIVYTINVEGKSNAYMIVNSGDGWSESIQLTNQNDYVEQIQGTYLGEGLVFVNNRRCIDISEVGDITSEQNNLEWFQIGEHDGIEIQELLCFQNNIVPNQDVILNAKILNSGTNRINELTAIVSDGDVEIARETLEVDLKAGATQEINIEFTLPETAEKKTYSIELTDVNNEAFVSDIADVTIGYTDLQLTTELYQVGNVNSIIATVQNNGFEATSGTVIFYEYGNEKNVYDEFDFDLLSYKQKLTYAYEIERDKLPNLDEVIIGVKVVPNTELRYGECSIGWVTIYSDAIYPVCGISISSSQEEMVVGERILLHATVMPENATNKNIRWESSNTDIVSVGEDGTVTALKNGQATVYAISEDGNKKVKCRITVREMGCVVSFDSQGGTEVERITDIEKGNTIVLPENPKKDGYIFEGWYTMPNGEGEQFTGQTKVYESLTVYAKWKEMETLAAPIASILSETGVVEGQKVSLSTELSGVKIYYTLDGTTPTEDSFLYKEPIVIKEDTIISAMAVKENYKPSSVAIFVYYVTILEEELGDILPEDIPEGGLETVPEGLWIAGIEENGYAYTGKAIKPIVRVYDYKTLLQEKTDYTISYKNNTKANDATIEKTAPTITVTGKGNYSGKETITFIIKPLDISGEAFDADDMSLAYNKKEQKVVPTLLWNGKKLKNKTDFTVSWPETQEGAYKDLGTYLITLTGKGNFTGSQNVYLTITEDKTKLIGKTSVSKIAAQYYTGSEIEPSVTVKMGNTPLTKGTDYTVEYEDNTEVGIAYVVITGKGDYCGQKRISFKINGTKISSAKVVGIPKSLPYTGNALTEDAESWEEKITLTAKINKEDVTLQEGEDYTISYSKNTNVGTATVLFTGVGGFTGTMKKTFKITAYDMSQEGEAMIEVEGADGTMVVPYAKGGSKLKPEVKYGDTVLVEGVDYTLSYKNNSKVNDGSDPKKKPQVTVKGKGNFKGSRTIYYSIEMQDISLLEVTAADKVYSTKRNGFKSSPKVYDLDGKVLSAGKDYDNKNIRYTYEELPEGDTLHQVGAIVGENDAPMAGTVIRVTVVGKGVNYSSAEVSGTYRIVAADIKSATVKIEPQYYTGKEITLSEEQLNVSLKKEKLTSEDFEIVEGSYVNNVKKGSATVTIKGTGNYGGTKKVKFAIKAKGFVWWWRSLF